MTPERLFLGKFSGFGCAQGLSGRVLRRWTVEFEGTWSEEHRALYLDERYIYIGQEAEPLTRSWVVHSDEQGSIIGHDAHQAAHFRGRQVGQDIRIVFHRPRRPGGPSEPKQIVRFIEIGATHVMAIGRISLFGLPIAFVRSALTRLS